MALINCPECGKEISNKVQTCPHCGYPYGDLTKESQEMQKVEIISVNLKPDEAAKTKKVLFGFGALLVITIITIIGFSLINTQREKGAFNTYIDNLSNSQSIMLTGGAIAEELNNLTALVWRNSIYEESDRKTDKFTKKSNGIFFDDFNDALTALYNDVETQEKIADLEENQVVVLAIMKDLQNPPKGLENCYETITDLYTAYQSLTDLAINPSGSLQSFSAEKNERVDEFLELYKRLDTQIPDKQ